MRRDDRRNGTGTGSTAKVCRRRRGALGTAAAAVMAATTTCPAAAPASHDPYPGPPNQPAPLGTAQAGLTLRTSEPLCGGDDGQQDPRASSVDTHGGHMAFWKSRAVLACGGSDDDITDDGLVVLDIADPAHPVKLGELRCMASASDIAMWGDLVFLAVERDSHAGSIKQPVPPADESCTAPDGSTGSPVAGVRIVSIADPAAPELVRSVRTNLGVDRLPRGARSITVVPDLGHRSKDGAQQPRVLVYTALPGFTHQDIVAVPLDTPEGEGIVGSVSTPGLDGVPTAPELEAGGCSDISFFLPRGLATCHATSSSRDGISGTIIWDVRDDHHDPADNGAGLLTPKVMSRITSVAHESPGRRDQSSAFSWDGRTLVISDDNPHGLATNSCDPARSVLWFYDVTDPRKPEYRGSQAAHPVPGNGWCPSKQISVVPLLDGRDVLVASWLGGGTTVVDFTDPRRPRQTGVFVDFLPFRDADALTTRAPDDDVSRAWASYWYAGHVFVNNAGGCARKHKCFGSTLRGLDVLRLHDIAPDDTAALGRYNFGTQECLPRMHNFTTQDVAPILCPGGTRN